MKIVRDRKMTFPLVFKNAKIPALNMLPLNLRNNEKTSTLILISTKELGTLNESGVYYYRGL